jgi:hypothetical protein
MIMLLFAHFPPPGSEIVDDAVDTNDVDGEDGQPST